LKKNKEYLIFLFIGFCALIVSYPAVLTPSKFSLSVNDLPLQYIHYNKSFRAAFKKSFKPLKIIAAGIDRYTLEKIPYRFPFPRFVYGELIKNLNQEKVNTIGFDLVFEGASSDPGEDAVFSEALKNSTSTKVVLAFILGSGIGRELYLLPQPEFRQFSYALGFIDNQKDQDQRSRRLNAIISSENDDQLRYSLSVQLAASYLNKPASQVVESIPVFKKNILPVGRSNIEVKNFLINYVATPEDKDLVINVSFYDLYANMEGLKKKFGRDFLRDSLVLVYPEAEILHDTVVTPLGKFPGGFLHVSGLFNIISSKFILDAPLLTFFFLAAALAVIFISLRYVGFFSSFFIVCGIFLITFWAAVAIWLKGIALNLAQVVLFSILFFTVGNIYKYVLALLQLEQIKNKVALDPLRNLYTLNYFYYHFDLSARKFYPGKELYLFFIYLKSLKAEIQNMSLNSIRSVWQNIQPVVKSKGGFWATYSAEEVVGGVFYSPKNAGNLAQSFKNTLQAMFKEKDLNVTVKIGYLKVKKEYSPRELLFVLSGELKKRAEEVIHFDTPDFHNALKTSAALKQQEYEFLQSIDFDIEEKNRELLEMIENLSKEQIKTQDMFFQVILSLVNALEARDPYSEGHSQRVASYALKFAEKLGWNKLEIEKLRKASLLHDLGKIGIPDSILHKKDRLSDEEFDFIKKHEIFAVKILEPIKEVKDILPWILYHHERWDGKGYPHGLGGNSIPLASQIISLADVYDALTTGRDYKKAMTWEDSLAEIEKNKGVQFNPEMADVFVQVIRELQTQKNL
jgi:putative nucleotidyltransferase with HDIG domain